MMAWPTLGTSIGAITMTVVVLLSTVCVHTSTLLVIRICIGSRIVPPPVWADPTRRLIVSALEGTWLDRESVTSVIGFVLMTVVGWNGAKMALGPRT